MENSFIQKLKVNEWNEIIEDTEYHKGNWFIIRDTGSWWMVGTTLNPRVFDVPEAAEYLTQWTVNLIEHLCKMEDIQAQIS